MSGRNELCKPKFLVDDNAEIYHEASSHWLKEVLEIYFIFLKIQESLIVFLRLIIHFSKRNREKKNKRPEMVFFLNP